MKPSSTSQCINKLVISWLIKSVIFIVLYCALRPWINNGGWSDSPLADPDSQKEQLRRSKDEWKRQDEDRKTKLALEKAKLDRAKDLERQDKAEEQFWLDQRRDDLDKTERKAFDKNLEEGAADAGELSRAIRAEKLEKAEAKIDASKKAQNDAAKPAAAAPAGKDQPAGPDNLLDELGAPAPAAKDA